ncbi:MAG: hypothetical protein UR89_C0007G0007 [Candidatus Roizmanbacteria bacterium GW2011_GWA2_35_8]|uniref:Ribulose-phosphate 3-epimerase n=1 Tax=Candidatus Roizmanbacteria bacterium GW2011_GWA2_35_8 TaxID=1618479 RepID=A0A0G0D181_9BACT|nr:MAG: hypothetical protein UR89_C0007G0007 [Candidatus Roizmanbacteria bacterium GW2011_GWA2_35_8]
MQICPSMPEPTMQALASTINRLSPFYNYFQIDIGDGIYVKNKTVQIDEIENGYKTINNYQSLVFDFHLMVKDYENEIEKLEKLKNKITIKNIFIHFDLYPNLSLITSHYSLFNIGLVLNPQDHISDLNSRYALKAVPFIQIMSVTPGVQGNPLLSYTLNKIEQLRLLDYKSNIFLDGAVNDETLPVINKLKFKPDIICPGSYLCKTNDLKNHVDYLLKFT